MWPFNLLFRKKKNTQSFCLNCSDAVDTRTAPTIRFQYFVDDEAKIATEHLCEPCAQMFKSKDDE